MRILLIEDSRFLRTVIERILVKAGHSVTGVADGREGLRAARTSSPALILLDMMLPGPDGTGVLKALKEDASTAQIPVIVLTGLSQKSTSQGLSRLFTSSFGTLRRSATGSMARSSGRENSTDSFTMSSIALSRSRMLRNSIAGPPSWPL